MKPESWLRLRELFAAAVLLAPGERERFLDRNCGDDDALRREVESLLAHDAGPSGDDGDTVARAVGDAAGQAGGARSGPTPSPLIGQRIGSIRVLKLLGKGGMGEVYVGFDETLQRRVAVKSIRARHRLSEGSRARFLREARILSQLDHPNICRIHNFVEGDDSDYLVLELIEGRELQEAILEGLEPARRMDVAIRIAEVLEAAHGKGVIHRDLKPQNVMVTTDGETKVLDFGLARSEEPRTADAGAAAESAEAGSAPFETPIDSSAGTALALMPGDGGTDGGGALRTQRGQIVGTPIYMSPEQAKGEPVTTASDMYSFGLLLQTLYTGRAPYPEGIGTAEVLARAGRADTLPVTGLDKDLGALIGRLKSAAPAARPTAVATLERLRWIRDKPKRRLRRLIAAAVLALLAVGAAKYTYDLKVARDRADQRREQAEDLIGFMIGDLRSKLAPVNRLEVLDEIGDKALDYFAAVPAADLSDDELLFRSQTLSQIGQVRMDQGNLGAAKEAFADSLSLAQGLVERDRENDEWLAWLGAAHFWIGYVDWRQGRTERSLTSYRAYLEISRHLVERDPENLDWQLELSYAYNNIGSVLSGKGRFRDAAREFRSSVAIKRRLVDLRPDDRSWRRDLAGSHVWLGRALLSSGDLDGALAEFRANFGLLEELVQEEPDNTRHRWLLAIAYEKVGSVLEMQGRAQESLNHYLRYLAIIDSLVEQDVENSTWQRELAVAHQRVAVASGELGDLPRALENLGAAASILMRLTALDASNSDWQQDLAWTRVDLATVLGSLGQADKALKEATEATRIAQVLLESDRRDSSARLVYSRSYLALGETQLLRRQEDEAKKAFLRAHEALNPAGFTLGGILQREAKAQALLRLGRIDEARPIVTALHGEGFRRLGFRRLCQELGVWP